MITWKVSWLRWDISIMFLLPLLADGSQSHCGVPEAAAAHARVHERREMGYGVKHGLSDLWLNVLPASLSCLCPGVWKALWSNSLLSSLLLDFEFFYFKLTLTLETVQQCMAEASRLSAVSWGKPLAQLWQQKNDSTCRLWGLWGWRNDKPCMKTPWSLFAPFKAGRHHRTKTKKPTRDSLKSV